MKDETKGLLEKISSYIYGEGRTANGQMVEFTCRVKDGEAEKIREFLKNNVRTIDIPTTGRVNVSHGGYGQYTRYDIVQHDYVGGGPGDSGGWGYIEVLEIKNPPDGRWGIVINENSSWRGSVFTEWKNVKSARNAFTKGWGSLDRISKFPKLAGFKRQVVCNALTPWFYAIGDEELVGDYTFPEGLQDDPVYRFGRKFVVLDSNGIPAIKICIGARFLGEERNDCLYKNYKRLVYWDDGSMSDETHSDSSGSSNIRPVDEGELWIVEAVQQFKELLAGVGTNFTINFTDGKKFFGNLVMPKRSPPCVEGEYYLVVTIKGEKDVLDGWLEFKPTIETPDIIKYATKKFAKIGKQVERLEVKRIKAKKGGKKWAGVFFDK